MAYEGIKFSLELTDKDLVLDSRFETLQYWCFYFHEKNLAPPYPGGSFGNLSYRLKNNSDEFIITGSKIGLKEALTVDKVSHIKLVDYDNFKIVAEGRINPSSETFLHAAIYQNQKDVNAIFHGHSESIMANTEVLSLPVTKNEAPYGTLELVNEAANLWQNNLFILKNHGFFVTGKDMNDAGNFLINLLKKIE